MIWIQNCGFILGPIVGWIWDTDLGTADNRFSRTLSVSSNPWSLISFNSLFKHFLMATCLSRDYSKNYWIHQGGLYRCVIRAIVVVIPICLLNETFGGLWLHWMICLMICLVEMCEIQIRKAWLLFVFILHWIYKIKIISITQCVGLIEMKFPWRKYQSFKSQ